MELHHLLQVHLSHTQVAVAVEELLQELVVMVEVVLEPHQAMVLLELLILVEVEAVAAMQALQKTAVMAVQALLFYLSQRLVTQAHTQAHQRLQRQEAIQY
jgi:hypothetical protein